MTNVLRLKKSHPKFNVPNFGVKKRSRVPDRWRKQRGIDNKKRIKKDFMGATPTIGYRNPDIVSGMRVSGNRLVVVNNMKELESYAGQPGIEVAMAHAIGNKKRALMQKLADQKGIKIVN
jgi:large subunit ribosomal protein L32e